VVEGSGTSPASAAELWAVGASFDQELGLGFPVGVKRERATFDEFEPDLRASWSGDRDGVRSCHVWRFEPVQGGGTRVHDVEVFTGTTIGLVEPLVGKRWNRLFQASVDGVIAETASAAEIRPRGPGE